jgi:type II secretory pathway pseudopilin PulG
MRRATESGFSLIEILVVVMIIMILVALIVVATGGHTTAAQVEKTKAMIQKLELGLKEYKAKYKKYPPSDAAYSTKPLHQYLGHKLRRVISFDASGNEWVEEEAILQFTNEEVVGGDPQVKYDDIADAWLKPMKYKNPGGNWTGAGGLDHRKYCDVWSLGYVDSEGTRHRITNWKPDEY